MTDDEIRDSAVVAIETMRALAADEAEHVRVLQLFADEFLKEIMRTNTNQAVGP